MVRTRAETLRKTVRSTLLKVLLRSNPETQDRRRSNTKAVDRIHLGIEEMVVTAQKREENLQAVPISISALSATDIERRGVNNPADLLGTMPNMGGFTSPGSRGTSAITMRGVAGGSPRQPVGRPGHRRSTSTAC
jgi:outer membrane receptor protein involved in Fe transport